MNKNLLFLLPVAGVIGLSFFYKGSTVEAYHSDGIDGVNFTVNPPAARTGAPGEGKCTGCHSVTAMSGEGVIDFTVSGGPDYMPGSTYPITISSAGGANNGFQLTILDGSNNAAGTFTAGPNSSITSSGGRNYIRHNNSVGQNSWTFEWTAPAIEMGELTAYYTVNKANNNGNDSGDEIFISNTPIPLIGASIQESELEKGFNVYYNATQEVLNLSYSLTDRAKVVLNVQDLNGRLITHYDFGNQNPGSYQELISLSELRSSGIYLVSLFVDNHVMNRKVNF